MARFVINAQKTGLVQLRERDSFQTGSVNITNVLILDKEVTVRCPTGLQHPWFMSDQVRSED